MLQYVLGVLGVCCVLGAAAPLRLWSLVGCMGPSWELGAYNLQHRGYRGTQVGVGNLDFCNIVGPNWELGIWEFIAKNDIVGGHLGKQKHWH